MKAMKVIIMTMLMVIIGATVVLAADNSLYQLKDPFVNANGQREVDLEFLNNGGLVLQLFGNGGNVWDNTHKKLITSNCKSEDYFGVSYGEHVHALSIVWVDKNSILWITPVDNYNPVAQGIYNGLPFNVLPSATNANQQGTSLLDENQIKSNVIDSGLIVNGTKKSSYVYKYDGVTYKYTLSKNRLEYSALNSTSGIASDVECVAFVDKYIVYVNDSEEMYAVELGRRSKGVLILEDVEKVIFKASDSSVIDTVVADGDEYSADEIAKMARKGLKNK